jgi:hypothetical protein
LKVEENCFQKWGLHWKLAKPSAMFVVSYVELSYVKL